MSAFTMQVVILFQSGWKYSYLVKKDSSAHRLYQQLDLESIPRYILLDNNLNIIDENFASPHDENFIRKLKELQP